MYLPDPPCCLIPGSREKCNESCCCTALGKFGFSFFDVNRKYIMLSMAFGSFVCLILGTIGIASLSHNEGVVMDTYWTLGKVDSLDFKMYIGIEKVVTDTNDHIDSFLWSDADCDSSLGGYCDDCKTACDKVVRSIIINFITLIPAITGNIKRSTHKGDLNCTKFMTILSGLISSLTILISLSTYQVECYSSFPEKTDSGATINYSLGPGFICLLIPQLFKPLEVIVNILTPVGHDEARKKNLSDDSY